MDKLTLGLSIVFFHSIISTAQPTANDLFNQVSPSLAIITAGTSTGSGFICDISGKIRLVTNEHVLRNGRPISATLINGQKLRLGSTIHLADDLDLAIIDIIETNDISYLTLSSKPPQIGEHIYVFGNSDGGGVATSLEGNIIGVGPDRVEIDAAFVLGNSGSPIILSDGTVFAVATYIQRSSDPKDWVKKGTRFKDTRRFGLLLSNRTWIPTTPKEYFSQITMFEDVMTYAYELLEIGNRDIKDKYIYDKNSYKYIKYKGFCQLIDEYSKLIIQYANDIEKVNINKRIEQKLTSSEKTAMGSYYDYKIKELENIMYTSRRKFRIHAAKMIHTPTKWLNEMPWVTKRFREESDNWVVALGVFGLDKEWIQMSD
jgi:hypothetical protein